MAEEKDIALLADNDIIVEIEVQEAPTVVIDTTSTTTAEISGDSALGIVVGALPRLAKEKTLADGISSIEGKFDNIKVDLTPVAKEATLIAKVAELKEALNSIDFTTIEQAIQGVENVTAREATLIQGVGDIIKAVENIDFTYLENSIAEVKNITAKETSISQAVVDIINAINNIDLTKIDNSITEVKTSISKIDLSSIESKVDVVGNKIDKVDPTELSKQGNNPEATNTKILEETLKVSDIDQLLAIQLQTIIGE